MSRTPGFIDPSSFENEEQLAEVFQDLRKTYGYTPLNEEDLLHSSDEQETADFLAHHGVKGMKWGVRNSDRPAGTSRKTERTAKKDAKEFARAKQFYGEGAGNRRKLIKGTVEGRSQKDPKYKEAFDRNLQKQDLEKHTAKAKSERKRKDVKNSTTKTARGISHYLRGNSQYASAAAATLAGGAIYIHKSGIDKTIFNAAKVRLSDIQNYLNTRNGMDVNEFFRKHGTTL